MKYSIYQLNDSKEGKALLFETYDNVKNKVDKKNYVQVWTGDIEESDDIVDDIYKAFGVSLPIGFYGHTPSISDVIVLENGEAYYINDIGFAKLDENWNVE